MESKNNEIAEQEKEVAMAQEEYINKVRDALQQMEQAQEAAHKVDNTSLLDYVDGTKLKEVLEDGYQYLSNKAKEYALVMETKICEWISLIIRLIGEVLLQAILYGLLVAQRIFMHLLEMVAPLMFAISLSPHFKSAWSQWLSKYISLSLWGFVAYCCMYYVFAIISYELDVDAAAYAELAKDIKGDDVQVAAIGMQAVGTTCMYIVGLLVGVKVLSMVPEAASWLIPGGVSSSAGSAAGGAVTAGAMMAGSYAGAAGGAALGATATVGSLAATGAQATASTLGNAGAAMRDTNWTAAENAAAHSNNRGGTYNKLY